MDIRQYARLERSISGTIALKEPIGFLFPGKTGSTQKVVQECEQRYERTDISGGCYVINVSIFAGDLTHTH